MSRVLVPTLLVLVGCTSSPTPSPVRGNVVEITRGGTWSDEDCDERHAEFCCRQRGLVSCTTFNNLSVVTVRVDGNRVAALILSDGIHLILAISDDRGSTWRTVSIDDDDFSRGGQAYRGGMDLFLHQGDLRIYLPRPELGALGGTYSRGYLYRVEMSTGKLSYETLNLPGAPMVEVRDGRAIFLVPDRDPRGGPQTVMAAEIDPADHANDLSTLPTCALPECDGLRAGVFQGSDDGDNYLGFTNAGRGYASECLIGYSRSRQALGYSCVPSSEWPATNTTDFAVFSYVDHEAPVLRVFDAYEHAWAVTINDSGTGAPPSVSAPADLGPGHFFTNGSFGGRPRHRGLAIVIPEQAGPGVARLVRLHASGLAQDVILPPSPCEDATRCGDRAASLQQVYGQAAWTEPMGNDEYLVFYLADMDPALNSHTAVLSVALEKATFRDLEPGAGFPASVGPSGYPHALESNAIEKMCVRQQSCLGGSGGMNESITTCLNSWTVRPTVGAAEHQAALLEFLATPPGCAGFVSCGSCVGGHCADAGVCVFPSEAAAGCNSCTPDGKAITCSQAGKVTRVLDCAAVGQSCFCTRDENGVCVLSPACVRAECTSSQPQCDGEVWSTCDQRRDCNVLQMSCSVVPDPTGFGGCVDPPRGGTEGCLGPGAQCSGRYLLTCVGGRMHWTDCAQLGFSRCGLITDTNAQRCLP